MSDTATALVMLNARNRLVMAIETVRNDLAIVEQANGVKIEREPISTAKLWLTLLSNGLFRIKRPVQDYQILRPLKAVVAEMDRQINLLIKGGDVQELDMKLIERLLDADFRVGTAGNLTDVERE